jgi:hypothetical protein
MNAMTNTLLQNVTTEELHAVEGGINPVLLVGSKPWFQFQMKLEAAVDRYPWLVKGPPYGPDPDPGPCPVC